MFEIVPYTPDLHTAWNVFVAQSKNATFLFDRRYMDYHADRFRDCSLMVYDNKGRLFALMPANRVGDIVYTHQGLTYGGLILGLKATAVDVCEVMTTIAGYLSSQGVSRVIYKALPWIYTAIPSDEPLYALTEMCHAKLISRDIASVVNLDCHVPFSELRFRGKKKAVRHDIHIDFSDDFTAFWDILTDNLRTKYGAKPVHTLDEILLLKSRFPENILLCAAFEGTTMVAGTVLYLTTRVAKTQYISASPRGKEVCALDLLFINLLSSLTSHLSLPTSHLPPLTSHLSLPTSRLQYLDMGTSAMNHSTELKRPLIFQKEGFGARAVCYDTYEWTL